jgi:hypothetical protein
LLSYRTYADSDIELGELDGEGNLNVVVSNFRRKGKVFENRIPQKNKSFQNENKNAR